MDRSMSYKIKTCIITNNEGELIRLLNAGLDPNFGGGWPIRLAARYGAYSIVKTLLQFGCNPHLLSESGASTLQLAVYSGHEWSTDKWYFLLSCCDSSQLADGAAVAIIFNNIPALEMILRTGRCNTNIPTTLTGKTVEYLARGFKLQHILTNIVNGNQTRPTTPTFSSRMTLIPASTSTALTPRQDLNRTQRDMSPSVIQFFNQTSNQTELTPPRIDYLRDSPPEIQAQRSRRR